MEQFAHRQEAGRKLATKLTDYGRSADTVVLALPRGGVPVAYEIAKILDLPLDIMLVRKLGVPGHEELAMGAIANGDMQVLNEDIVRSLGISGAMIERAVHAERNEMERRSRAYREGRPAPDLKGCTVILADDGMATGATMRVAVLAARQQQAARVIVAVPIASDSAYEAALRIADEVICVDIPKPFYGVGAFYRDFAQTSDREVKALLHHAKHVSGTASAA